MQTACGSESTWRPFRFPFAHVDLSLSRLSIHDAGKATVGGSVTLTRKIIAFRRSESARGAFCFAFACLVTDLERLWTYRYTGLNNTAVPKNTRPDQYPDPRNAEVNHF
jgi:hypothetical protein